MMRAAATGLLLGCWAGLNVALAAGDATGRPNLHPTRDVEIVYQTATTDPQHGDKPLEQRMRWLAAGQVMRIDPPTPGMHVIIDYVARRMSVVRDGDRSVIEMAAPQGAAGLAGGADTHAYVRRGDDVVAGTACTIWETTDRKGRRTLACFTVDGVLLRASVAGQTLASAVSVNYAPQDPAVFRIPSDYAHGKAGDAR